MLRALVAALLILTPMAAGAATWAGDQSITLSEPAPGNTYLGGTEVKVEAPVAADLLAAGANIRVAEHVEGDALLVGGAISVEAPVEGDLRILGAQITVSAPVTGEVALGGAAVTVSSTTGEARIAGGTVAMTGGSTGAVSIYGADVYLSGVFSGDVDVVASERLVVGEGAVIQGALRYNAPQEASVAADAQILGGVSYTGASYLPTVEEARRLAFAGASVLFIVKVLASMIAVGVVAALLPEVSQRVAESTLYRTPGRFALMGVLGFGIMVAVPVLVLLLLFSFVGIGLAFILGALYLLLILLSYVYAAVLAGAALSRGLLKRTFVTWKTALLGALVLQFIGVIPVLGGLVLFVLTCAALGALVALLYEAAYDREESVV